MILWLLVALGHAQDTAAEQRRLEDELLKHAQRNTWPAVEKTYERLLALGVPLTPRDHLLGAQSALNSGDALLAWFRLGRMVEPGSDADAADVDAFNEGQGVRDTLQARYGLVSIYVPDGKLPALARPEMPFAQDERDVIGVAREKVRTEHAFRGMLPAGSYSIDGHHFDVPPGWDWRVVVVGDPTTADAPPDED